MAHPVSILLNYCTSSDWAMRLSVLEQMSGIVERHISGAKLSAEEIDAITNERNERVTERKFEIVGATAMIPVTGVIAKHANMVNGCSQPEGTSIETLRDQLAAAIEDPRVESIFLMIESPGGCIDSLADFADDVFAASFKKPVVAFADDLCASAAYWIASQANVIYASQTADVGSIGVYTLYVDSTERAKQEGLKFHIFRSGDNKGVGSPGVEISEANRDAIQERIDAKFEIFLNAIMQGRAGSGLTKEDLRTLADGRCFVGQAAVENKLIDGIKTLPQAMSTALPAVRTRSSVAAVASAEKNQMDSIKENEMSETDKVDASAAAKQTTDAVDADRKRVAAINTELAGDVFADLRAKAIESGMSVADAKAEAFTIGQTASAAQVKTAKEATAVAEAKVKAIAAGGSDAVAIMETSDTETTAKPKAAGDSDDPSVYENYCAVLEGQGKTPGQAIIKASARYPKSHEAAVKEMPVSTAK